MQVAKTIYFSDYPSLGQNKSGLTIPFSQKDAEIYRFVKPLSSHAIRQIIGFEKYHDVETAALAAGYPVSTYVRNLLGQISLTSGTRGTADFFQIQSTFRGGCGSPLHEWFPFLEGYSPEFVSAVIEQFTPHAHSILDPFCGSGTTALVAALRGGVGYYSEVNPVLQFVINAKTHALTLSGGERIRIAARLNSICEQLEKLIPQFPQDTKLKSAFTNVFGTRRFFTDRIFVSVLQARSYADELQKHEPLIAKYFVLAVLRSLVPCSLLMRRGDLRFMTEREISRGLPDFNDEVARSLRLIASDFIDIESAPGYVNFLSSDARHMQRALPGQVDAIITSPPYLNGTNYFRNTKIELWFTRHLVNKHDLRNFRDMAVTSGINDVTRRKLMTARRTFSHPVSKLLATTLDSLQKNAYDARIPAMVENYFYDMHSALSQFPGLLSSNGMIAVDLGDSIYSGVHVPTQDILAETLETCGLELDKNITLRERQSRDGTCLTQTLQVFRPKAKKARNFRSTPLPTFQATGWQTFKFALPHKNKPMACRNWGHKWHSMCSYQGKLKPSIAHCLIDALMPESNGRLLDIFSGVGTIPFEARLRGHSAFAFDISPVAVAVSRAKVEEIDWGDVASILDKIEEKIDKEKAKPIPSDLGEIRFNGLIASYFHEQTLREIISARRYFLKNGYKSGAAALVLSCVMHILHGNRPYALSRRSHPIIPFAPTGSFEYRSLMARLREKIARCQQSANDVPVSCGAVYDQDAAGDWPTNVASLDAIITSPPFFNSTRFYAANWMRLWFAGWEASDFTCNPTNFVDERQKASFSIYEAIFQNARNRLKNGGVFAIHVGKSKKCDMAEIFRTIGQRYFHLHDWFTENVEHCESHGIPNKGSVTHHQYLLFTNTKS